MKTKRLFAQEIIYRVQNNRPNIDSKLDERDVFLWMDQLVNERAKQSFFEKWQFNGANLDEQYLTRWDDDDAIIVNDYPNSKPSRLTLPASYVDLPNHRGIDEIWPMKYGRKNQSVVIMSHRDIRAMQNNKASNLQGRLGGYPKGNEFVFTEPDVAKRYGSKFGVSLVIRDSSAIGYDEPYPVPADFEKTMIEQAVEWFLGKRSTPADKVRDNQDQP